MQGIMRPIERHRRGHSTLCRDRQDSAADAAGTAFATGVMTLAPAFSQALPSLVGVRTDHTHETNRELPFHLCAALVREGLGNAETWKQADGSAIRFAQSAISGGIGDERDKLLTRNVEYHLLVSDALERYGEDAQLGSGRLAVDRVI